MSAKATVDSCQKCEKRELVSPLHGERGGPVFCIPCGMEWHGKHGRRRKMGRIVIKAMKAYLDAGGSSQDFLGLKLVALGVSVDAYEADTIGAAIGDITSELLNDTLQLTHPDHQPPERREIAQRVTQELIALKPFVFPAPKPEPEEPITPEPRDASLKFPRENFKDALRSTFPCADCANEIPYFYCTPCKAEHEKRWRGELERDRAKQREWYRRRKLERERCTPLSTCICSVKFKPKRSDAKHCSPACRQKAYRQRKGSTKGRQRPRREALRELGLG